MPKSNSESDFGGSITSDDGDNSDVDVGPSSPITASHHNGEVFQLPSSTVPRTSLNTANDVNPSSHPVSPTRAIVSPTKTTASRPGRLSTLGATSNGAAAASKLRGIALFRASAWKIMQMRQLSVMMGMGRGVGAEPGIDPRHPTAVMNYGHLRENCAIQVVDYSSLRSKFHKFDNKGFADFLEKGGTTKQPWAKVRWISIGGISWDVLSALASTYDIHPLSFEDVVHRRGHIRSKADYFSKHLSVRVLCHSLGPGDVFNDETDVTPLITNLPRSSSPTALRSGSQFSDEKYAGYEAGDDIDSSEKSPTRLFRRKSRKTALRPPTLPDLEVGNKGEITVPPRTPTSIMENKATLDQLKAGVRVHVKLNNLFIFLFRDGTIISIHEVPTSDFAEPILARLRSCDTVLRSTADASLLLESILDLVVDHAVEVVEEYQKTISKLECNILLKPDMTSVRHLHILSGDLTLHKRTLAPFKSLVYGLRRYDLDRCLAIAASSAEDSADVKAASAQVVGYMSHKSKVYLADVHDHVEYILSSLDMFAGVSENLINYTFNVANYEMSQVMRRLTLATIIFLPLTLLTGYFGMNFNPMWSVNNNSDALFWKIAVPVMTVVISLFLRSDIISLKHFLERKMAIDRRRQSQRQ